MGRAVLATRKERRPVIPRLYLDDERARQRAAIGLFHLGRNDSVGELANLFPAA